MAYWGHLLKRVWVCGLVMLFAGQAFAQLRIHLEGGWVWQHRNDVKIPPDTGTRLNFDEFDSGAFPHYRVELIYKIDRHGIRALYAPFEVEVKGLPTETILFDDRTFAAGQELTVNYQFNSYRLTYFYNLVEDSNQTLSLGFTGKIRDAEIKYNQSLTEATYDNQGFVPLLYFSYWRALSQNWSISLDGDAAAASQGRAIDVALKIHRQLSEQSTLALGGRTLEGGADNDKVFTFSWFNYLVAEFRYSF